MLAVSRSIGTGWMSLTLHDAMRFWLALLGFLQNCMLSRYDRTMTQPSDVFLQQMKQVRTSEGLTQAELAERLAPHLEHSIDASTVARIESGRRSVRLDEAVAIAKALGLRLDEMIPSGYTLEEEAARLEQDLAEHHAEIDRLDAAKEEAESSASVIELRLAELRDRIADEDAGE